MMKLLDAGLSPNALRARAVIFELGLPVELEAVNPADPAVKAGTLRPVNPNTKVPVLVEGDFVLWESRAIIAYLAAGTPLYPADPKHRAIIDQWNYWGAVHLGPALQGVSFERFMKPRFGMGSPNEAAIASYLTEIARFLPVLHGALSGKDWIAGDLSIADFAIAATLIYRDPAGIDCSAAPNVLAWMERIEARPSWQKAIAPVNAFIAGGR
jgi:glutathione S-transferase